MAIRPKAERHYPATRGSSVLNLIELRAEAKLSKVPLAKEALKAAELIVLELGDIVESHTYERMHGIRRH